MEEHRELKTKWGFSIQNNRLLKNNIILNWGKFAAWGLVWKIWDLGTWDGYTSWYTSGWLTLSILTPPAPQGFQGGVNGKEPACQFSRRKRPSSEDSLKEGMENPMDRRAWLARVVGLQSQTLLKWLSMHARTSSFKPADSAEVAYTFYIRSFNHILDNI